MKSGSKHKGKVKVAALMGVASFIMALFIAATTPMITLDLKILDFMFELRGPLDTSESPIVLVAISDQADSELDGKWPWPTHYHARLVENLNKAGAKVIAFDVVFNQPDEFNPANDSLFATMMERYQNVVLAGNIEISRLSSGSQSVQLVQPYRLFRDKNPNRWGFVSVSTDTDSFLRRYLISRNHLGETYFSFGMETIRLYKGLDKLTLNDNDDNYFDLGFVRIPKFVSNSMLINFHGPPKSFPEFSYEQIIDDTDLITVSDREFFGIMHPDEKDFGTFDDPDFGLLYTDTFKDKIVLVGATMLELQDYYATPFAPGRTMPGYEAHANAIQTILSENFIRPLNAPWHLVFTLLVSLIIVLIGTNLKALPGFVLTVVFAFLLMAGMIWSFVSLQLVIPYIAPILGLAFAYTSSVVYNFVTEQKEKSRIQGMFGTYVSPELVNRMVESGEEPRLGGDEVYMTAFFSDIQSFSAFSEKLEPTQLVELLNEYLSSMTNILTAERGTLDKYIGDAIVAFFGAPVQVPDHALRACVTSQLMILRQKELREQWASEGDKWPDVVSRMQTRIGINTGHMVTGNMGSASRFNYTMMGDNVNLAARCESGAKAYGVYVMVTEETKLEAEKHGDDCVFRQLDKIVVMGRSKPVSVYEIVALRSQLTSDTQKCISLFEEGLHAYFHQKWEQAISLFEQSAEFETYKPNKEMGIKTNPSLVLLERCKLMKQNPPPADWDGVYVMTSK